MIYPLQAAPTLEDIHTKRLTKAQQALDVVRQNMQSAQKGIRLYDAENLKRIRARMGRLQALEARAVKALAKITEEIKTARVADAEAKARNEDAARRESARLEDLAAQERDAAARALAEQAERSRLVGRKLRGEG